MNKIEELYHLKELLKKHDLPISPILEYAINERETAYLKDLESLTMLREQEPRFDIYKQIDDYCLEFAALSVGVSGGKKLPHKALVLLSIMNLIENDTMNENRIELDKVIANQFTELWRKFMGEEKCPSVWTPFWYLKSESFWHFKSNGDDGLLEGLLNFAGHPSIGQMRAVIKYAYLDEALFNFMQSKEDRQILRNVLLNTYLPEQDTKNFSATDNKISEKKNTGNK
ncbi:MAG: hypothetical protein IKH05_11800 [Bacteroidaceae bacterium]|nr:hypothetical protein [Bacteroidaceae bacterium]